ncbi:4171_t:CDS:2, partial [Acaulospora colombiana]
ASSTTSVRTADLPALLPHAEPTTYTSLVFPRANYQPAKHPDRITSSVDVVSTGVGSTTMSTISVTKHAAESLTRNRKFSLPNVITPRSSVDSTPSHLMIDDTPFVSLTSHVASPSKIQSNQVLVKVECVALEGLDVTLAREKSKTADGYGFIPGRGFCGRVLEAGYGVSTVRKGDWVMGLLEVAKDLCCCYLTRCLMGDCERDGFRGMRQVLGIALGSRASNLRGQGQLFAGTLEATYGDVSFEDVYPVVEDTPIPFADEDLRRRSSIATVESSFLLPQHWPLASEEHPCRLKGADAREGNRSKFGTKELRAFLITIILSYPSFSNAKVLEHCVKHIVSGHRPRNIPDLLRCITQLFCPQHDIASRVLTVNAPKKRLEKPNSILHMRALPRMAYHGLSLAGYTSMLR